MGQSRLSSLGKHITVYLINSAIIVFGYYLSGQLGLRFSILPENATPIFPAAGLALAAILLGGYKYWPALVIGGLLLNVHNFSIWLPGALNYAFLMACLITAGSTLQALFGAWLLKSTNSYPSRLENLNDISRFLFIGGPLSCLIGAIIAVCTFVYFNAYIYQQTYLYLFKFIVWWIGDSTGVILFAPPILLICTNDQPINSHRKRTVIFAFSLIILTVIAFFKFVGLTHSKETERRFQQTAQAQYQLIKQQIDKTQELLHAAHGLFTINNNVTRQQFYDYVQNISSSNDNVLAISWIPKVTAEQRAKYEAQARNSGITDFTFTQFNEQFRLVKASQRPIYYPVYYIEPLKRNRLALGFDMLSNEQRGQLLSHAVDHDELSTLPSIHLIQGMEGLIFFEPVYRDYANLTTISERRANNLGVMSAVVSLNELVQSANKDKNTSLQITVDMPNHEKKIIYDGRKPGTKSSISWQEKLKVANQTWLLDFHPTLYFFAASYLLQLGSILILGFFFSLVGSTFLLALTGRTDSISRLVDEKTQEIVASKEKLKESESGYRAIFATAGDAIITIDAAGIIESANQSAEKLFRYSQDELLGEHYSLLFPNSTQLITTKTQQTNAKSNIGRTFPVEISIAEFEKQHTKHYTIIIRDISDRQKQQREINEQRQKLQAIMDSSEHAIIATDQDGTIILFNQGAERMLGYRANEMVGKLSPLFIHKHAEIIERAESLSRQLKKKIPPNFEALIGNLDNVKVEEYECTYISQKGEEIPVLVTTTRLRNEDGSTMGYMEIAQNISERKKIETLKNEFISVVSHELRTPLTSIHGSISLLASGTLGSLPDRVMDLLKIAKNNTDRLIRLINDILDIQKIEANKIRFTLHPYDINELVKEAIEANYAYGEKFSVSLKFITHLPATMVTVDHDRFIQVMTNLLSNAIKFSPTHSEVEVMVVAPQPGIVRVSVKDKGVGIPEAFQASIFQKFAQADSTTTRTHQGTGLGLNISKQIIERFNGTIGFSSAKNKGTIFYFDLPIVD